MKSMILLLFVGVILFSCEKNDEVIVEPDKNPFIGIWDYKQTGFTDTYTFTDTKFVYYMGGQQAEFTGTYTYTDKIIKLVFDEQVYPDREHPYELIDNKLTFGDMIFIKRQ